MENLIGNFLNLGEGRKNLTTHVVKETPSLSDLKNITDCLFPGVIDSLFTFDSKPSTTITPRNSSREIARTKEREESKRMIFMVFSVFTCILVFSVYVQKFMNKNNMPSMIGIGLMVAGLISEIFSSAVDPVGSIEYPISYYSQGEIICEDERIKEITEGTEGTEGTIPTAPSAPLVESTYEKIRRQCQERKLIKF